MGGLGSSAAHDEPISEDPHGFPVHRPRLQLHFLIDRLRAHLGRFVVLLQRAEEAVPALYRLEREVGRLS
jgi:hypothetical protein